MIGRRVRAAHARWIRTARDLVSPIVAAHHRMATTRADQSVRGAEHEPREVSSASLTQHESVTRRALDVELLRIITPAGSTIANDCVLTVARVDDTGEESGSWTLARADFAAA